MCLYYISFVMLKEFRNVFQKLIFIIAKNKNPLEKMNVC